ncbi:hypothetical protein CEXT_643161 [Caerostris extrusa]|uniref:Uncharacterized protein n=1 Tax=Caerostris extrusa TaxID=172846 RepID=A0AAV4XH97_CAEEX|nr:hypothetical protein CEXT_643161 [Caerostris extrusa]
MISESEENDELSQELNEVEQRDCSDVKTTSGHTKPKRLKGRKQRRSGDATGETQADENAGEAKSLNDEKSKCIVSPLLERNTSRPTRVPKAPKNTTSFIMDDNAECKNFENFLLKNSASQQRRPTASPRLMDPKQLAKEFHEIYEKEKQVLIQSKLLTSVEDEEEMGNMSLADGPKKLLSHLNLWVARINEADHLTEQVDRDSISFKESSTILPDGMPSSTSFIYSKDLSDSDGSDQNWRAMLNRHSPTSTLSCSALVNANLSTLGHSPAHHKHSNLRQDPNFGSEVTRTANDRKLDPNDTEHSPMHNSSNASHKFFDEISNDGIKHEFLIHDSNNKHC